MKFSIAIPLLAGLSLAQPTLGKRQVIIRGSLKVTNLAPEFGTCQTPVWVGIHDGNFDIYDRGVEASAALEAIAEDGTVAPLASSFDEASGGVFNGVVVGDNGPICPGESATLGFELTATRGTALYLSYASMVLPSNDAFVANGDPKAHLIFNPGAQFRFDTIVEYGSDVLDAGTEVNDEIPENTAFFGQMAPNTGVDENSVVSTHPGFRPTGSGGILDSERFSGADFTAPGYKMMSIEVILDEDDRRLLRGAN